MLGRILFWFILLLVILWGGGLWLFAEQAAQYPEPVTTAQQPKTDGIVVLTGGSERIEVGLALLQAGIGKKLLISGVNPAISGQTILAGHDIPETLRTCCIMLGRLADDTIGNAEETRTWMKAENFQSISLVTANYHMPRALLIFHQVFPDRLIVPYAVTPDDVQVGQWWQHTATTRLLISEYHKTLLVLASRLLDWR